MLVSTLALFRHVCLDTASASSLVHSKLLCLLRCLNIDFFFFPIKAWNLLFGPIKSKGLTWSSVIWMRILVSGDLSFALWRNLSLTKAELQWNWAHPWVCVQIEEKDGWPQEKGPWQLIYQKNPITGICWQKGDLLMTIIWLSSVFSKLIVCIPFAIKRYTYLQGVVHHPLTSVQ